MNDLLKKVAGEILNGKELNEAVNSISNDEIKNFMIEIYGINERIFDICPEFLKRFDMAMGAISNGEPVQREEAISFIENMERIGVIKPGSSLVIRDKYYNFNELRFTKNKDEFLDKTKPGNVNKFVVEMPMIKGLSKEELKKHIMEQIKKQGEELPEDILNSIVEKTWESYKEFLSTDSDDQEENSNV